MGIEGIGSQTQVQQTSVPTATAQTADVAVQQAAAEIAPLFGSGNSVSVRETSRTEESGRTRETTDAPQLDEADLALIEENCVDLEALIAELQADQDEAQIQASKERIESMQGELKAQHESSMEKINESLDAMRDQEKSQKLQEALGWLSVALAVVGAVVSVLTCGGASAVFAVIGAVLAVGMQVLSTTGVMDDIVDWVKDEVVHALDELCGNNLNSTEEEVVAEAIIAAIELAISIAMIACGNSQGIQKALGNSVKAVKTVAEATKDVIKTAMLVANTVMTAINLGASAQATATNYRAGMTEADVTDMEAILKKLQELLDQESEDLEQLLQQLSDSLSSVIELLGSKQDTLNSISMNIGA